MYRTTMALAALCLAAFPALPARAQAGANKVVTVRVSPSGATLNPGQTIQFTAEGLNKQGNPVPGLVFKWSSKSTSVATVDTAGLVTATNQTGNTTITAKYKSMTVKLRLAVVPVPGGSGPAIRAGNLGQVNHVLVDAENIYWTETDGKLNRVRKTSRTGGAIYDLATEPVKTKTGLSISYVRLVQVGSRLFWSRQTFGFRPHFSIRSVPKAGGTVSEVLKEDVSLQPLLSGGWQVSGKYLIVSVVYPERIPLPANTRIAAYDTETGIWTRLITGHFVNNDVYVTAADDQTVFVRGQTENRTTETVRLSPTGANNTYEVIHTLNVRDDQVRELGATDGTNLYFWSRRENATRLLSVPVTGGSTTVLFSGSLGSGLVTDGQNLYFARGENQQLQTAVRLSPGGGTPTPIQDQVFDVGASSGLAVDDTSLFLAVLENRTRGVSTLRIVQVNK